MEQAVHFLLSLDTQGLLAIFWFYFVFEVPRYTLSALAVGWRALFSEDDPLPPPDVPVSVLLAGHNEGAKLPATARSLREQSHGELEIVVVDDGSSDDTRAIANRLLKAGLIDTFVAAGLRGGKASALNLGLSHCSNEFLVVMDIDTSLDRDAIGQILAPLEANPGCGAVSGSLAVRNWDQTLLTQLQAIEYTTTIVLGRQFTAMFDILTIVSGAFGAFRRSAIEMVGGWDVGPGDDSNLTTKLRRAGWSVRFAPDAWALTDVPVTTGAFYRQRMRWNRSLVRNRLRKFRTVFNPLHSNFTIGDVVASVNVLWFHLFLALSFVAYMIYIITYYQEIALTIIIAVHLLILAGDMVEFVIAAIVVRRLPVVSWLPFMPLQTLFDAYFKRTIRLMAYLSELTFRHSYDDPFYPRKVRDAQDQF